MRCFLYTSLDDQEEEYTLQGSLITSSNPIVSVLDEYPTDTGECLFGKLNKELEKMTYNGGETNTASVVVDGDIISANVKSVPYKLKIVNETTDTVTYFDGSEEKEVIISADNYIDDMTTKTVEEDDVPYEGARQGDLYIDVTFNNSAKHIYVPLNDLDTYKAGDGIIINNENNVISAVVTPSVLQNAIDSLTSEIDDLRQEVIGLIEDEKEDRINAIEAIRSSVESAISSIQSIVESAVAELGEELDTRITSLSNSVDDRISSVNDSISSINTSVSDLQEAVDELAEKIGSEVLIGLGTRLSEIESNLAQEIEDRISGDTDLAQDLTYERSDREAQESSINSRIDSEVSNRQSADLTLNEAITNLSSNLTSKIEKEAEDRETADTAIYSKISSDKTELEGLISDIDSKIDDEIEDRANAVSDVSQSIQTLSTQVGNRLTTVESNLSDEIASRQSADKTLQDNIYTEVQARVSEHATINKAISDETTAREEADSDLQDQIDTEIENRESAISSLTTFVEGKLNTSVLTDISYNYSGDNVTTSKSYRNLNSGATSSESVSINLANSTTAGLMSPASVKAIQDLTSKVSGLEGQAVRLMYDAKSNPTAQDISSFVTSKGYTTNLSSIDVVVNATKHIWHYYQEDGWIDDGLDTVNQFTNTFAGIILGSQSEGKVYAEDDGTGSVVGWNDLKSSISNLDSKIDSVESSLSVEINSHEDNKSNPHEVTKEQVGLGNVDNTSDINKPISTATQSALDKKTEKIELIYDNNSITYNGEALKFSELLIMLKQTPNFIYLLHNGWVHLCTYIQDVSQSGVLRYIRFSAALISNDNTTNSKNSLVYIESVDGINITTIRTSVVINENTTYKSNSITDSNKGSTSYYTSIKAVTDYAQPKGDYIVKTELDELGVTSVNNRKGEVVLTKSDVGLENVDNTSDSTKKSNFTGTITSGSDGFVTGGSVYSALNNKVDKVSGKGLSTNDYTTLEKNKLSGIESNAQVNVIEKITIDGVEQTVTNKTVNIPAYPEVVYPVTSVAGKTGDVTLSKSDVGLSNVGNFKAVSTVANQGLSETEKSNARANIGVGTYSKPDGGIPKSDLSSSVQASLNKADTALQSHQDISGKEDKSNKITSLSSTSTDIQYLSARALYNILPKVIR